MKAMQAETQRMDVDIKNIVGSVITALFCFLAERKREFTRTKEDRVRVFYAAGQAQEQGHVSFMAKLSFHSWRISIFWLPCPCLARVHAVLYTLSFRAIRVSFVLVLWLLFFFSAHFLGDGPLRVFELRASS